jgi:hypothetical protein
MTMTDEKPMIRVLSFLEKHDGYELAMAVQAPPRSGLRLPFSYSLAAK